MKKAISDPEAWRVARSLALRMETHFPVAALAILLAEATLEDGVLTLRFHDGNRDAYRDAKRLELAMKHFTDATVRVERVRGS